MMYGQGQGLRAEPSLAAAQVSNASPSRPFDLRSAIRHPSNQWMNKLAQVTVAKAASAANISHLTLSMSRQPLHSVTAAKRSRQIGVLGFPRLADQCAQLLALAGMTALERAGDLADDKLIHGHLTSELRDGG
jgi:hypothetical protein